MEIIKKLLSGEKAISTSALKEGKKSTRSLIHYYQKDKVQKLHFDFGNAMELYLIDKPEFFKKVAIMDESKRPEPSKNYQTKVNQEWKADFYNSNSEKYIIPAAGEDSFEVIQELEELAKSHPMYDVLVGKDMNYQDPFTWECPYTGLQRYSRTDLFSKENGIIIDIKTDANDDFEKTCRNQDYFLAAVDQIEGALRSGKMEVVKEYYWFVLSKKAPYFVDAYKFEFDTALKVEEVYQATLRRIYRDLSESPEQIVWRKDPITTIKTPNFYS